ncbi:MAG: hypothetical protein KC548_03530, partial [Nanoarchaeota archaeon]|nr:hypothetical protein [Nanoarchaeota archaeon]
MDDKKGIVVSITLLLLLVIAIIGTLMFQGWFFAFSSNIFVKTEDKGKESISLEALIGDSLFINNRDTANITIEEVTIAGKECSIKSVLTTGMNIISLETCNYNSALGIQDIVVRTQKNLYEKKFYSSINTLNTKTLNSFSDFQTGSFYAEGYYPVTLSPEGDILLSQAYVYSASSLLPSFFYKNNKFGVALGSNNLLYISSSSYLEESAGDAGVAVIDTQGTISPEDDLLLGIYNQSSTPALSIPEIYSLEYDDDNDLLYVGGFGIY